MELLGMTRTVIVDLWRSVLTRSPSVFHPACGGERRSAPSGNSSDLRRQEIQKQTHALCLVWTPARVLIMKIQSSLVKTMFIVRDHHLLLASLPVSGPRESFKKFRS